MPAMAGKHRDPEGRRGRYGHDPQHADKAGSFGIPASSLRSDAPPRRRPMIGQPQPGEEIPATYRGRAQVRRPAAPRRHGAGRQVGTLKAATMAVKPQHTRSVASQTKRDRATRRDYQRKAGSAVGNLFQKLWALGYR